VLSTDREEFVKRLRVLFAGLDKPLGEAKETAFWKALAQMSLIEFSRCCDFVLEELQDADKRKEYLRSFSPGEIWQAKSRLRSRTFSRPDHETETTWTGDSWDTRANEALMGYIGDQARLGIHYCDDATRMGLNSSREPTDETRQLIAPLIAYKNAWATDMREIHSEKGFVSKDEQVRQFRACMARADEEVKRLREWYATRRAGQAA